MSELYGFEGEALETESRRESGAAISSYVEYSTSAVLVTLSERAGQFERSLGGVIEKVRRLVAADDATGRSGEVQGGSPPDVSFQGARVQARGAAISENPLPDGWSSYILEDLAANVILLVDSSVTSVRLRKVAPANVGGATRPGKRSWFKGRRGRRHTYG